MLETTFENDGYDGIRGDVQWWFASWGTLDMHGHRSSWTVREKIGRPPMPQELARADFIVYGFRRHGHVFYKTRTGGLDL